MICSVCNDWKRDTVMRDDMNKKLFCDECYQKQRTILGTKTNNNP